MQVGDKVPKYKKIFQFPGGRKIEVIPVCSYIHPKRRFFTLEYSTPGGTVRESFSILTRKGEG